MPAIDTPFLHHLLFSLSVLAVASILVWILRRAVTAYLHRNTRLIKVDPTNYAFLKNALSAVIYTGAILFIIYSIPSLKQMGTALFAGAGIFAAVLAFASQAAFSNIIGGIFIIIYKPFRVGDIIDIGNDRIGTVEDINLRHTVIRDFQFRRIIVPNATISQETILNSNYGDDKIRKHIHFGISYDSDIDLAIRIIQEEGERHPLSIDGRSAEDKVQNEPVVKVRVIGFGDSSVNLRAWVWASDPGDAYEMSWELNKIIKERFDREGIEIPFPYRTLVYKRDLEADTKSTTNA